MKRSAHSLEMVFLQKLLVLQQVVLHKAPHRLSRSRQAQLAKELATWLELLLAYRKKVNVIGPTTAAEIIDQHIMDCLLGLPFFLELLCRPPSINNHPPTATLQKKRLADLGSGAGFPGLPLALAFRALGLAHTVEFHLVEAKSRKTHFIEASLKQLQLSNVKIHQKNLLELKGQYQIFTSRAFAKVKKTLACTRHLRLPSSVYLLYKGKKATLQKELTENKTKFKPKRSTIIPLKNPFTAKERNLLAIEA